VVVGAGIQHIWLLTKVGVTVDLSASHQQLRVIMTSIANLQKMAVAERREPEPTTQHRNEVGLAVRQATIVLLAESCRQ